MEMRKNIIFGAGYAGKQFAKGLNRDYFFVDNNEQLQGTEIFGKPVKSPKVILLDEYKDYFVIIAILSTELRQEITQQLLSMGLIEGLDFSCISDTHFNPCLSDFTMLSNMKRLKSFVGDVGTVFDIGASCGIWSEMAMNKFPESEFFLIEANSKHEQELKKFTEREKCRYILAAAGDKVGEIYFRDDKNKWINGATSSFEAEHKVLPMVSIDYLVETHSLKSPYILKFDTHGFELKILEGAKETLKNTSAIVMELFVNFLYDDSLVFFDMCKHLSSLGFKCVGLADPMLDPDSTELLQMDLIFIRKD